MKKAFLLTALLSVNLLPLGHSDANAREPYIGEIAMFGFNFCPAGWLAADGHELQIAQNAALFSLLGNNYGGDGRITFALPDLRGRSPVHYGQGSNLSNISLGQNGGQETTSLASNHLPSHTHSVSIPVTGTVADVQLATEIPVTTEIGASAMPAASGATYLSSTAKGWSPDPNTRIYSNLAPEEGSGYLPGNTSGNIEVHSGLSASGLTAETGEGEAFNTRSPYLAVIFCIAKEGVFPSR